MPRITAKREKRETGLAGVCQPPRGYIISVTNHGEVGCVFAKSKGYRSYQGWSYMIYDRPELGLPRIEAWREPGVVPEGKIRCFKFTEEGRVAAKTQVIKRIKELLEKPNG